MSSEHYVRGISIPALLAAVGLLTVVSSVHANIYATNIKLNGNSTTSSVTSGSSVAISYILNEPAATVTVNLLSGTAIVRSLVSSSATNTARGLNTIFWDGKSSSGQNVAVGSYSVSITATSIGHTNWAQITSDLDDTNSYVIGGQGIAVDQNPSSAFYGRVFVANAWPDPGNPNDAVGILK